MMHIDRIRSTYTLFASVIIIAEDYDMIIIKVAQSSDRVRITHIYTANMCLTYLQNEYKERHLKFNTIKTIKHAEVSF